MDAFSPSKGLVPHGAVKRLSRSRELQLSTLLTPGHTRGENHTLPGEGRAGEKELLLKTSLKSDAEFRKKVFIFVFSL